MSALNFVKSATLGIIVPQHCGKSLKFGIITSRCSACNETFDTLDVTIESEKLNGRDYNLLDLVAHLLTFGLLNNFPLEVPPFSLERKETQTERYARGKAALAELAAESEALAVIAKARGK